MIITGKTKSGFSYQIQKEQVENYEFVELIGEVDENPTKLPKVLKMLFGKEQTDKLKDHLRTEDGFVPTQKMIEEFSEVLNNPKLKN
ncbi:hypothetical protein LGV83_11620 [Enterococcus durans]|uniref:hypothetical protein n=1 Tax=Enterococcus TaxID=1350 RepID=UPI0009E65BA4|nr:MULTISPECIES: hypothetical protein [Enterococcus]MBK4848596.1 hypothetical protein [Enterococcus faecium]MBK4868269.1 hypothetical protein [Enterococcus faecium]MCG3448654.1 hypothetical protein [Enterococcus durans]MDB1682597.1 hypothetical protein [Enterococcus durans]MDB1685992.1 hypothetical protein [Enterococcus durans]